uniref:PID domain-containing protein n=1 Tax=Syphacia muris TaxID=451379 RepID=A0A0N5AUS8_9BILA
MLSLSDSTASTAAQFFTLPFRRRRQRYTINQPDEVYSVIYLGNVLTVMAKGSGAVDKPLSLIWKTYCSRQRSDLQMKLAVTRSGLKAETKHQGLTEYWAHRITYCIASSDYPRVFCWVYKHEGKRMKPELRCHAVLCRKLNEPSIMATRLNDYLQAALREYRREKICMQNSRICSSLTGQAGTCPRRKLLLQTGSLNFRPPVSRSRSAPRLGSIDEGEEEIASQQEDDFSDLDSLCYRECPGGDDDCASSSAASTSSAGLEGHTIPTAESVSTCDVPSTSSSLCSSDASATETEEQISEADCTKIGGKKTLGIDSNMQYSCKEPDSISDESGYHDICYSDDDCQVHNDDIINEDDFESQVTPL